MKSILLLILLFTPTLAFTHSGGLDKFGGHINKSTGEYHQHKVTEVKRVTIRLSTGKIIEVTVDEVQELKNCLERNIL